MTSFSFIARRSSTLTISLFLSSGASHAGTAFQSLILSICKDSRPARIMRHKSNDSLRLRICDQVPLASRTSASSSSKKLCGSQPSGLSVGCRAAGRWT